MPGVGCTRALGRQLARHLSAGDIVRLRGALGSGKSELARAIIRCCAGSMIEVPSPTFTIMQDYPLADLHIIHADLYRLADGDELKELGLSDVLAHACLIVEWPEVAGCDLPSSGLVVEFQDTLPEHEGVEAMTSQNPESNPSEHDETEDEVRFASLQALDERWAHFIAMLDLKSSK